MMPVICPLPGRIIVSYESNSSQNGKKYLPQRTQRAQRAQRKAKSLGSGLKPIEV